MTQKDVLEIALKQSAADCSCSPADFTRTDHVITEAVPSPDARKDRPNPPLCRMISFGSNIVAACRKDLIPEITAYVNSLPAFYRCFEIPYLFDLNRSLEKAGVRMARMGWGFLPDMEAVFSAELPCRYETRVLHPEDFKTLYVPEWGNALCEDRKQLDMLGVGAYDGGRLAGLAGCSADGAEMWQIGIDVLPEYRRQGIASALTVRLARAIFEQEKLPFYSAAWSNVRSFRNALRCGFRPAFVELSAEELPEA